MSIKRALNDETKFMDLSAIGCSLLLEQQNGTSGVAKSDSRIRVTMSGQDARSGQVGTYQSSNYLSPRQAPPPPYPCGLTPYQSPYVSPYATPFQTPSPSPLSSVQSSPATSVCRTKGPGIDEELAMILESEPFIWEQQPASSQAMVYGPPPPPYPLQSDRVTGRPPHPRPSLSVQPSRTLMKQQLQRHQLEQQERRERELIKLQSAVRPSSYPSEKMAIPIIVSPQQPVVDPVTVPAQVLTVRTRLENPTLYHVIESRKRQVREFLQQGQQQGSSSLPLDHRPSATVSSAPPGGFVVPLTQHPSAPTDAEVSQTLKNPISFSTISIQPSISGGETNNPVMINEEVNESFLKIPPFIFRELFRWHQIKYRLHKL